MDFSTLLEKLYAGAHLQNDEARELMYATMDGALTPVQISAWLSAMRMRAESSDEIAVFAEVLRDKAVAFTPALEEPLLDTCGTGGDRSGILNVSTLAALTLASMGIKVAKHGNRAVSSKTGSADLLEKLGYPVQEEAGLAAKRLAAHNFVFLFAPAYHPAMKYAGPVRKEMGVRTVFNLLGPLANPARASLHVLGVFQKNLMSIMANALHNLGVKHALVVHSRDGLDEISPCAPTDYILLSNGNLTSGTIDAGRYSRQIENLSVLRGGSAEESFELSNRIIDGTFDAGIEMVAINAAAGFMLSDLSANASLPAVDEYIEQKKNQIYDHIKAGNVREFIQKAFH
ncbi:MAG: anthranilate phosphoribosyltransferase [Leptospiraceae bacterium]|nr:anthranilate phosphoribosyltransferase [Leptospiraceae bacterium]